jgi:hypothetical protein
MFAAFVMLDMCGWEKEKQSSVSRKEKGQWRHLNFECRNVFGMLLLLSNFTYIRKQQQTSNLSLSSSTTSRTLVVASNR